MVDDDRTFGSVLSKADTRARLPWIESDSTESGRPFGVTTVRTGYLNEDSVETVAIHRLVVERGSQPRAGGVSLEDLAEAFGLSEILEEPPPSRGSG